MKTTSSLSDAIFIDSVISMILGIPIVVGIAILAVPLFLVSCIIGIPFETLIQTLLVFGIAVFIVWLFSRFQIIENGIVGFICGWLVYSYLKLHPAFCILVGVAVVGVFFGITKLKVGFWIKTILFSLLITIIVYVIFYSKTGLFPASDNIWRVSFFVIFLLENLYIRCSIHDFTNKIPINKIQNNNDGGEVQ